MKEAAEATNRQTCYEYNQEKIQATFDSFEEKGVTNWRLPTWTSGQRRERLPPMMRIHRQSLKSLGMQSINRDGPDGT